MYCISKGSVVGLHKSDVVKSERGLIKPIIVMVPLKLRYYKLHFHNILINSIAPVIGFYIVIFAFEQLQATHDFCKHLLNMKQTTDPLTV